MSDSADINTQCAEPEISGANAMSGRNIALFSMTIILSVSTIFCAVKSLTIPDDINELLMRKENARIEEQLEKTTNSSKVENIHPAKPTNHICLSNKQSRKTPRVITQVKPKENRSIQEFDISKDQQDLQKLRENFKGGTWDE